jgi:adenylate cyclase
LGQEQRRLAAILAADVVGYSRLMAVDEPGTLARLKTLRGRVIEPRIAEFHGHVVGSAGDSLLVEFPSAMGAVACAVQVQQELDVENAPLAADQRMIFRIGVNLGDVIPDNDTIYGDGVNIAARLEKLADPGGVCISAGVYDQVRGKLDHAYDDIGPQRMHNIAEPVRAYRVKMHKPEPASRAMLRELPALPDKPSIAVLPFQNLGGDPEQDYFADGMLEDIITALAQFRHLFVIARNSSFAYKGRTTDTRQLGRELGVRYLVEGSVRRAGERVRIGVQLIDAATGAHLWADRFDGSMAEVFELQDQVASSIAGAITPRVEEAEIERAKRKPTESLDAYDYYLRGLAVHDRTVTNRDAIDEALRLFMEAIALDPAFAQAYARAARCYATRKSNGTMVDRAAEIAEATRLARKAVELGRDDAVSLTYGGYALGYVGGELDDCVACIDRALLLNRNLAAAWGYSGWAKACSGEPDTAIEHAAFAMRLSPLDPRLFSWQFSTALAHFCAGRYDDAVSWARISLRAQPHYASAMRVVAAAHALGGRSAEAGQMIALLRQLQPTLRLSNLADVLPPFRRQDDRNRYVEGLRKAGLPE